MQDNKATLAALTGALDLKLHA